MMSEDVVFNEEKTICPGLEVPFSCKRRQASHHRRWLCSMACDMDEGGLVKVIPV